MVEGCDVELVDNLILVAHDKAAGERFWAGRDTSNRDRMVLVGYGALKTRKRYLYSEQARSCGWHNDFCQALCEPCAYEKGVLW